MPFRPPDPFALLEPMRYRAFLSYRAADRPLAEWLHSRLEAYRVPAALVGTSGERGPIPARLGPIFRDRDDARTAADIETIIARELATSRDLIVVCTPAAASADSWVSREIELFRLHRPDGQIHAVIGGGEVPACFPPGLLRLSADATVQAPLAADLRRRNGGGQDGRRRAVGKLAAGLIGVPFDALWQRERRRRRRRALACAAGALLAVNLAVGAYVTQRASRFIRQEGDTLVVYAGVPSLNLPGLPVRVLSLDERPGGLQLTPSAAPVRVVAAVGPRGDIAAALEAMTRPAFVAAERLFNGDSTGARAASLRVVDDPRASAEDQLLAFDVLAETATAEDASRFPALLQSRRPELRVAGARALARVAPEAALTYLNGMYPDDSVLPAMIGNLASPCTDGHLWLLNAAFSSALATPQNADIVDAALRAGCGPPAASLLRGVQRATRSEFAVVAALARHRGDDVALAAAIDVALREPGRIDEWGNGIHLATLIALRRGACSPALRRALSSTDLTTRLTAMAAVGRFCAGSRFDVSWNPSSRGFDLALTTPGAPVMRLEGIKNRSVADQIALHRLIALLPQGPWAVEGLRALLTETTNVGLGESLIESLINTLVERGDGTRLPQSMFDTNRLRVRRAAIDHWRAIDERGVVRDLIRRLELGDESSTTLLGRIPLQAGELAQVQDLMSGPLPQQRQAACVLAMQGDPPNVIALLTNPEADLRRRAADCLPFNRESEAILARLPDRLDGFPLLWRSTVRQSLSRKQRLLEELQRMQPEVRQWTVEALVTDSQGWFVEGLGVRAWLQEQAFLGRMHRRLDADMR